MNPRESESLLGKKLKKERSNEENSAEEDNSKENEENGDYKNGRWEKLEHLKFLKGCLLHGNNWKKVKEFVKTRSSAQIRSHAQKYIIKLCKKYKVCDSKQFKNLKNLRKNTRNDFLNNLSLNLNQDQDDLEDLNNLEPERIEQTVLSIFKSYGNFSEKRDDDNLDLEDSNRSFSEDSGNKKANFGKGKIFGTAKIDKKIDKNDPDDADKNSLLRQNLDLRNLLMLGNQKNFDLQTLQNRIGKTINQKEQNLLLNLINSENNLNIPLINTNLNNNISNNSKIGALDELLKLLGYSIPNNISNVNNNYLNYNNFYQNNNNSNIINGLNNLSGMGTLFNMVGSVQNNIFPNPNPKAHHLLNDLSVLNSVIFENTNNNIANNIQNLSKTQKEILYQNNNKSLNYIDSNNNNINDETLLNLSAANFLKGNEFTNLNESLISNLFLAVQANNNNNNSNLFSNLNNNLNQSLLGANPQFYLNPSLLNLTSNNLTSANNILNQFKSNNNNSNYASNHSLQTINKISGEEKTNENDFKNSNVPTNNIRIEGLGLYNLNSILSQQLVNQNNKIEINKNSKSNTEEDKKGLDCREKTNNNSISYSALKIENDLMITNPQFDEKQLEMLLANQDNIASLKNIHSLQDLQCINQIFNMLNQDGSNCIKENNQEIYSFHCNSYNKKDDNKISTNKCENKESPVNSNLSADKNEERIKKTKRQNITKSAVFNGNKIEDINQAILLNILNSQQTSTSLEPERLKDFEILDMKDNKKQNENMQESIKPGGGDEEVQNQIDYSEKGTSISPLLLKLNEDLTNQINHLPFDSDQIQNFSLINSNKGISGLINLNQILNTNSQNVNSDLILNQGNLLNFQNILNNNNLNSNHIQEQLSNLNNIDISAIMNEHNLDNNNNRNLTVNRPNDIDNLNNFFQEYLKNCTEPN